MVKLIGDMEGYTIEEDDLLAKIATYLYVNTSYETSNGTRYINASEIDEYYNLPYGWSVKHANEIVDTLLTLFADIVSDCEFIDDDSSFDIGLYHNFAMGYIEDDQSLIENRQ